MAKNARFAVALTWTVQKWPPQAPFGAQSW